MPIGWAVATDLWRCLLCDPLTAAPAELVGFEYFWKGEDEEGAAVTGPLFRWGRDGCGCCPLGKPLSAWRGSMALVPSVR